MRDLDATTHSEPTYVVDERRALLRRQHAGRGGAHLYLRAQQRDPAVHAGAGRQGLEEGAAEDAHLRNGLNVSEGQVTCEPVAVALGLPYVAAETIIG